MKLQNNKFRVNISVLDTKALNFDDYDFVYCIEEFSDDNLCETHIITIDDNNSVLSIAVGCDYFLMDQNCAILEENILTLLQNNFLVQIDASNGEVVLRKEIEEFGGNWELHLTPVGYLVYGESIVATYDKELNQIWHFSGRDIFVCLRDKPSFKLCKNHIELYDFENNFYKLDFNGKQI